MGIAKICPDCPARNTPIADTPSDPTKKCLLQCNRITAREPFPMCWFETFSFGVVRRGVVVRERVEPGGSSVAIDAVGAGALLPLAMVGMGGARGDFAGGYAASEALICMLPRASFDALFAGVSSSLTELFQLQEHTRMRVERIAAARGALSASERMFLLLCALADTLRPARTEVDLVPSDLQQRDLAALAGIRPESACRIIRQLTRERAIERGADGIRILRDGALEMVIEQPN